jgi:hypothetical protein
MESLGEPRSLRVCYYEFDNKNHFLAKDLHAIHHKKIQKVQFSCSSLIPSNSGKVRLKVLLRSAPKSYKKLNRRKCSLLVEISIFSSEITSLLVVHADTAKDAPACRGSIPHAAAARARARHQPSQTCGTLATSAWRSHDKGVEVHHRCLSDSHLAAYQSVL